MGVASADGANFNLQTSNPDGTPVTLDAGNYVALFTTGMRYATTATMITLGGTNITPLFVGAQGQFDGLDQVNFQIPLSLAGRGEIDLIIIQDNKNSNAVRFRIR